MHPVFQALDALPNLHPAVVHFPIVLLPVALAFEAAALVTKQRWPERAATTLFALCIISTAVAYWAGRQAADSLSDVPPRAQIHIARHSDWGLYTLLAVGALVLVRLTVAARDRGDGPPRLLNARWALVVAGVAATALLTGTAILGGALVYEHGIGVQTPVADLAVPSTPESPGDTTTEPEDDPPVVADWGPPESRLVAADDGTLLWSPVAADTAALGSILRAAPGSSLDAVTPLDDTGTVDEQNTEGLPLDIEGRAMLLLPGTFGDVQIDLEVDAASFDGTIGLVHHATALDSAGFFTISATGSARLEARDGDSRKVLDEQAATKPDRPFELSVSSAGRHLKGFVDGTMVAHGHIAPGAPGGCGLWLDGAGTVRIVSLRVTPLS
ncbi:MAG: DUF2231 domain-containing protein [Acidobacteriota bacterium]